jgi:hypothetical protein
LDSIGADGRALSVGQGVASITEATAVVVVVVVVAIRISK